MSEDKQWEVKSYSIPFDQWTNVDVAWTNEQGLELYVGGSKVGEDRQGQQQSRVSFIYFIVIVKAKGCKYSWHLSLVSAFNLK